MELIYRIAADAVVVVHGAYVLTIVLGLVLILVGRFRGWQWIRNFWFRTVHLAMIAIVVLESWLGITCPLTTWEQQLRVAAGEATYQGDFIANLVHRALFAYCNSAPWMFTACYTAFGAAVAAAFVLAPPALPFRNLATVDATERNRWRTWR